MDINPYGAPGAQLERVASNTPTGLSVTEAMIASLGQTRPWVLFLAVLGFIGSGFMVLASLVMLVAGGAGAAMGQGGAEMPFLATLGIFVLYVAMAALYVYPSYQLFKYGAAIGRIRLTGAEAIEEALRRQKSFWRFLGIATVVVMALYIVAIPIAIGVAAFAGTMAAP